MSAWISSALSVPLVPALRSMPAQKVSPRAVSTAQRSVSSLSSSRQARYIPTSMGGLKAFFASGRFRVTIRTCPSRSTMQLLVLISSVSMCVFPL
jgi:hypothetical protein